MAEKHAFDAHLEEKILVGSKTKPTVIEAATSHVGSEQSRNYVSRPIEAFPITAAL